MRPILRRPGRAVGFLLLGLLVPGGALIVLATLIGERTWQRKALRASSAPLEL